MATGDLLRVGALNEDGTTTANPASASAVRTLLSVYAQSVVDGLIEDEATARSAADIALGIRIGVIEALGSLATDAEVAIALGVILGGVDIDADTLAELKILTDLRAKIDASNITPSVWRSALSVYSATQVDAAIAAKAPLVSTITGLTPTTGSVPIDFVAYHHQYLTHVLTGSVTYSSANLAIGKEVTLLVSAASIRALTFPGGWRFYGPKPTEIAEGKEGVLTLLSKGTTDAEVRAAWSVEE